MVALVSSGAMGVTAVLRQSIWQMGVRPGVMADWVDPAALSAATVVLAVLLR